MSAPAPVAARPACRREVVLRIALPGIPACTAVLGTGSVGAALVHGAIPEASLLVWPLVVLALGTMAYDIGLRAQRRRDG
ncbi:hypothetical protein [Streptomyces sp. I5]|uniref:hypothetical protein n=1 Tax=Streptomyces sp. I5 TaxID=2759947 RepID=UPI0018EE6BD2|nr:hypothetical protein [Streptomyces sp. I5]MBJ6636728.1 hypothetical protein [Streptomyces sp. I5]